MFERRAGWDWVEVRRYEPGFSSSSSGPGKLNGFSVYSCEEEEIQWWHDF